LARELARLRERIAELDAELSRAEGKVLEESSLADHSASSLQSSSRNLRAGKSLSQEQIIERITDG
jgi:glycerol-3-phosphate dehydrogenase